MNSNSKKLKKEEYCPGIYFLCKLKHSYNKKLKRIILKYQLTFLKEISCKGSKTHNKQTCHLEYLNELLHDFGYEFDHYIFEDELINGGIYIAYFESFYDAETNDFAFFNVTLRRDPNENKHKQIIFKSGL